MPIIEDALYTVTLSLFLHLRMRKVSIALDRKQKIVNSTQEGADSKPYLVKSVQSVFRLSKM